MVLQTLSFDWIHFTFVAGDWIVVTLRVVDFDYVLKSGSIVLAVVTGVRSLLALLILVGMNLTALEPLPTLVVHALHCHKLTPVQLIFRWWIMIQMFI